MALHVLWAGHLWKGSLTGVRQTSSECVKPDSLLTVEACCQCRRGGSGCVCTSPSFCFPPLAPTWTLLLPLTLLSRVAVLQPQNILLSLTH